MTRAATSREYTQYQPWQIELVKARYPLCTTVEDRETLRELANIETLGRLYNLASRLGATRTNHDGLMGGDNPHGLYDATNDESLLMMRARVDDVEFTEADDRYITINFGSRTVENIAFWCNKPTTAILYRARHLGLRKPSRWWEMRRVEKWLGIEAAHWPALQRAGIEIAELPDRNGDVKTRLVSAMSLARWLSQGNRVEALIQDRDADEFFCREIIESFADLNQGRTQWEGCDFLSCGHMCMNPRATASVNLFCSNTDRNEAGRDPNCMWRDTPVTPMTRPVASTPSDRVPNHYAPKVTAPVRKQPRITGLGH